MTDGPKLVAIGGGCTNASDPALDEFALPQSTVTHPHIGYIGTASNDEVEKIARFLDSGGAGLEPLRGLGLFKGSCCPHYSSKPGRQRIFPELIAQGELPAGLAIDDGVAVLVSSAAPVALSARPGSWAYRVHPAGDQAIATPLGQVPMSPYMGGTARFRG